MPRGESRCRCVDNEKISSYSAPPMPRRKPGTLLPLETEILGVALARQREGEPSFHGFALAQAMREQRGSKALTGHGTLYKALGRLEEFGLLASRWEDAAASRGGRAGGSTSSRGRARASPGRRPPARRAIGHPGSHRSPHDGGADGRGGGVVGAALHARPARARRPAADRRARGRRPRPHRARALGRRRRGAHRARNRRADAPRPPRRRRLAARVARSTTPEGTRMRRTTRSLVRIVS